jgi:hypothetical protein
MKHIKTLAFVALFLTMNTMFAQSGKTNWPKLNDVKEVAARINLNIEQNNPNAFVFTETLTQQVQQLKASTPPANFANKKTQDAVNELAVKADALDKKAKAKGSMTELKQQFTEIQTVLNAITQPTATK